MNSKTVWEQAASADGTTPSERVLAAIARKAFLSLWSYTNVFTDEGRRNGKGDGKELCDLLVVFGNSVLLFSDKDCTFPCHADVKVAWARWYRSAIERSARQLAGAEKFAKAFPQRIFLDKGCASPLPIALPDPSVARYYLIAVTRGSHQAAQSYFGGGSSGSLMLQTELCGRDHYETPFHIGFPLDSRRFVHVLDEVTVGLLLEELDTVPDLVSYLNRKEEFLQQPNIVFSVPGEEELLGRYMAITRDEGHAFPKIPRGTDFVALPEGDWDTYATSPQRVAKRKADEISYLWDALIEHQSSFIRAGTTITAPWQPTGMVDHERIVRALAEQTRLVRRSLSADLRFALMQNEPGRMFARIKMTGRPPSQAFVFLTIPRTEGEDYETTYRARRMHALTVYCVAAKDTMPTLTEAIGVASEPWSEDAASQDLIYVDLSEISATEMKEWRQQADELDILRPKTEMRLFRHSEQEFPAPFEFVTPPSHYLGQGGRVVNRAERRQAEREQRRRRKNSW